MAGDKKRTNILGDEDGRTPEEIAARVALLKAETLKAEAEAAEAKAGARKADVEASFGQENIESLRTARQIQDVQMRATLRAEAEQLAHWKYHHIYHFTQAVDARSTRACMEQLDIWHREDPKCSFEIIFSSPGGSVIDGMALFDYITQMRDQGHFVTTSTIGMAASMAGILLQAGDKRTMGREAYILIHQISSGMGGSYGQLEDEMKFLKKIQGRILEIFARRSKMSRAAIDTAWKRKDWWLDSEEALKLGFIDEIVGSAQPETKGKKVEAAKVAKPARAAAASKGGK